MELKETFRPIKNPLLSSTRKPDEVPSCRLSRAYRINPADRSGWGSIDGRGGRAHHQLYSCLRQLSRPRPPLQGRPLNLRSPLQLKMIVIKQFLYLQALYTSSSSLVTSYTKNKKESRGNLAKLKQK